MAVSVGPYQRIVGVNWPAGFGYIVAEMRLVFYGDRYSSSCSETVEGSSPPSSSILIEFSNSLELKPSKLFPSDGGLAQITRTGSSTSNGVLGTAAATVSGLPTIGAVTVDTDGYEFVAENNLATYGTGTESPYYQYVQGSSSSAEPIPGFEAYTTGLALDWVYTYPNRVSGPFCADLTLAGLGNRVVSFVDLQGTLTYPGALAYRKEIARVPLNFSGLSVTPIDSGKTYNAYAAWIPSQTGGNEKVFILCKPAP